MDITEQLYTFKPTHLPTQHVLAIIPIKIYWLNEGEKCLIPCTEEGFSFFGRDYSWEVLKGLQVSKPPTCRFPLTKATMHRIVGTSTQTEVSTKLGIEHARFNRLFNGKFNITLEEYAKIKKHYPDVHVEDFIKLEEK